MGRDRFIESLFYFEYYFYFLNFTFTEVFTTIKELKEASPLFFPNLVSELHSFCQLSIKNFPGSIVTSCVHIIWFFKFLLKCYGNKLRDESFYSTGNQKHRLMKSKKPGRISNNLILDRAWDRETGLRKTLGNVCPMILAYLFSNSRAFPN